MIRAAASIDEFMGLTLNIPSAPVPMLLLQGTLDAAVPYTMMKDTVSTWRAVDGLSNAIPVTTYEASPLMPGFVTIISGTHAEPTPTTETGYDCSVGMWAFFSQFLTTTQDAPKIVSQPVNNVQLAGEAASFRVAAASNTPVSYQWQRNGVDIPGATSNWYTAPPTTMPDSGTTFTVQPADCQATAGQPAGSSVTANGTGTLSYQWMKNGVNIVSATSDTYAIPATITADSGASFTFGHIERPAHFLEQWRQCYRQPYGYGYTTMKGDAEPLDGQAEACRTSPRNPVLAGQLRCCAAAKKHRLKSYYEAIERKSHETFA